MFMIAEPRGRRVFIQNDKYMVRTRLDHPPTRGPVSVPMDALHQQLSIRSLLLQVHHTQYTNMAVHGAVVAVGQAGIVATRGCCSKLIRANQRGVGLEGSLAGRAVVAVTMRGHCGSLAGSRYTDCQRDPASPIWSAAFHKAEAEVCIVTPDNQLGRFIAVCVQCHPLDTY